MPELSNRDNFENSLSSGIEKEFQRFARELAKLIPGLEVSAMDISSEAWAAHSDKLNAIIRPLLQDVFMAHSGQIIDALGFTSVDWSLVDTAASQWARQYSYELVRGLTDNSRNKLQQIIPQYFEQGWTQGKLTEQIMGEFGTFSQRRAAMIARTEVTRAASESAQETARELARQGIAMVPYWHTRNDEVVCPICGPRNGLEIRADNATMGMYPPAHPNCRCWPTYELPKD